MIEEYDVSRQVLERDVLALARDLVDKKLSASHKQGVRRMASWIASTAKRAAGLSLLHWVICDRRQRVADGPHRSCQPTSRKNPARAAGETDAVIR